MLIAYLDESYNRDFYFIGAAIAADEQWSALDAEYEATRATTRAHHDIPAGAEFHGHQIMDGKGEWRALRGKHREAAGVYTAVLTANHAAGVQYIFRGVDVARLNARYSYPYPPHTVVLSQLLERINDYTRLNSPTAETIIVADEIATQDQHQAQFRVHQELGTGGYRTSQLEHISPPINFANARLSTGLQAVDMATYIHRCTATPGQTQHPKAQAVTDRLAQLIYSSTSERSIWYPQNNEGPTIVGPSAGNVPVAGPL